MQRGHLGLLRVMTCGSVDDGKSTLIGRLLYDAGAVTDDIIEALDADSVRYGTTGGGRDYALLVDGLLAEREQGITIDVAHRYFDGPTRKYVLADTPGHEMYTRNMATAASVADVAILLVDARKGLLAQTRRHAILVHLLGVRHVVLAVNKMDLVGWSEGTFTEIREAFTSLAHSVGLHSVAIIPMAALDGANVVERGRGADWYRGPSLLEHLETLDLADAAAAAADLPLRLPVQWVCRPNQDFRGYAGTIAQGTLAVGAPVKVLPCGATTTVAAISTPRGEVLSATSTAVMVSLASEVPLKRGDWLVAVDDEPELADLLRATLVWMAPEPLLPNRDYVLRLGPATRSAHVTRIRGKIDITTLTRTPAASLDLNDIADCEIALDAACPIVSYDTSRDLGGFILVDRSSGATVAAGLVRHSLRRATNVRWHALTVRKEARRLQLRQSGLCLWFTGLSGAGKSTVANLLEKRLHSLGRFTYLLDGDNIRLGLNRDLGFTPADRVESIRRIAEVARLMVDAGLITIVAAISPYRADRDQARGRLDADEFFEVFVDSPLDVCMARDVKGLYAKAMAGKIPNFTGVSSPYEPPLSPEFHLDCARIPAEEHVERIVAELSRRGLIGA